MWRSDFARRERGEDLEHHYVEPKRDREGPYYASLSRLGVDKNSLNAMFDAIRGFKMTADPKYTKEDEQEMVDKQSLHDLSINLSSILLGSVHSRSLSDTDSPHTQNNFFQRLFRELRQETGIPNFDWNMAIQLLKKGRAFVKKEQEETKAVYRSRLEAITNPNHPKHNYYMERIKQYPGEKEDWLADQKYFAKHGRAWRDPLAQHAKEILGISN